MHLVSVIISVNNSMVFTVAFNGNGNAVKLNLRYIKYSIKNFIPKSRMYTDDAEDIPVCKIRRETSKRSSTSDCIQLVAYDKHFTVLCGVYLQRTLDPLFIRVFVQCIQSVLLDTTRSKRRHVSLIFFNGLVAILCEFSCG